MLAQKQLFRHDPPRSFGDCHRTAIACLLDLPVEHVPNWAELHWQDTTAWNAAIDEWLMSHLKLRQFHIVYDGSQPLETALNSIECLNPGCLFLLCGESKNQVPHTVIAGSGKIVWDPSRDNSGIVKPVDGYWWITMLVPHNHYAPHADEQAQVPLSAFLSECPWNLEDTQGTRQAGDRLAGDSPGQS